MMSLDDLRPHAGTWRGAAVASFEGRDGTEHHISVDAPPGLSAEAQLAALQARYAEVLNGQRLAPETAVFRRLFVSDVLNQMALVEQSALVGPAADGPAMSIVQQPPLTGAKFALLAYHVDSPVPLLRRRLSNRHLIVEKNGVRHLWSTRLHVGDHAAELSAGEQTSAIFEELQQALAAEAGGLRDHCVRTWIYVKDIDVFYGDMVRSRKALFAEAGLSADTHYIASTGIEGACAHRFALVAMDAYSNLDLKPGQMSFLNDFERLCPTHRYGVTFERGTRIAYADRAHCFLSGTASIDKAGEVVHPGDVMGQLERTLENIEALLASGDAGLADLKHLIVYLRDPADAGPIGARLAELFPGLPRIIVQGPVCRPEWLVEIEGVAVSSNMDPTLPSF